MTSPPDKRHDRATVALLALAIVAGTLAVFLQARRFEFVNWDDPLVHDSPEVAAGLSPAGVRWAFSTGRGGNWQPVTWLSHQLDAQLYGPRQAGGHHLTSVLLHAATALLVLLVFWQLTGQPWPSALVAALFAWHPLHVESVAWVFARKDILCAFFWFATLGVYVAQVRRPTRLKRYLVLPAVYALALLSKPMAVTLPLVLLLLDAWPLARFEETRTFRAVLARLRGLAFEKWPLFLLAGLAALVAFLTQHSADAMTAGEHYALATRLANAAVAVGDYLAQTFWPTGLAFFYPYRAESLTPLRVAVPVVVIALFTVLAWWQRRPAPWLLVGWGWFLITLLPVIGLVQIGEQARADRYTYLPLVGLSIALAWTLEAAARRWSAARVPVVAAASIALLALALLTHRQAGVWRDSRTLFPHAIAVTRHNHVAHNNLAAVLAADGDLDGALDHYRRAAHIKPDAGVLAALASVLDAQGRESEVPAEFAAALAARPTAELYSEWGAWLLAHDRADEAAAQFARALELNPHTTSAHLRWAALLLNQKQPQAALLHLHAAVAAEPDDARWRRELALGYLAAGNFDEGLRALRQAINLDPRLATAQADLGALLLQAGRPPDALPHLYAAAQLEPGNVEWQRIFGVALVAAGDLPAARACFAHILQLDPANADAHYNLGAVLQRLNRPAEAAAAYRDAIAARSDFWEAQSSLAALLADSHPAKAAELYRAALASQPRHAALHLALASVYVRLSARDQAIAELEAALAIDPQLQPAQALLEQLRPPAP